MRREDNRLLWNDLGAGVQITGFAGPVHSKNSIRPTDWIVGKGKVMDLNRFDDPRPATQVSIIGQVSI